MIANWPAFNVMRSVSQSRGIAIIICILAPCHSWAWPDTLPVPSGVSVSVVGEKMQVNGIPVRAYEYFWRSGEQPLLDFYSELWRRGADDEQPPFILMELGDWDVLSHIEDGYNFTVQYHEEGIKGIRVLLGISSLPKMLDKNRQGHAVNKVKLLSGMSILSVVESVDAGRRSETYWIDSSNSIEKTAQILEKHYSEEGFLVSRKNIKRAESGMIFLSYVSAEDKSQQLEFAISDSDGSTRIVGVWQEK
ncbi:hypothetical protein KXJ70_01495 [Zhongshania sp. CAU 1632]|uniref:Uncharacterized protein n=2 Tax=Zhongshania aquimaris TaxID=2857107 RepID=A0ABS6VM94_9GAMM|nr:hypothetical protein [Zhongshania aquimaris]